LCAFFCFELRLFLSGSRSLLDHVSRLTLIVRRLERDGQDDRFLPCLAPALGIWPVTEEMESVQFFFLKCPTPTMYMYM
jgi:hypothetical protein